MKNNPLQKAIGLSLLMSCWLCGDAMAQDERADDRPIVDGIAAPAGALLPESPAELMAPAHPAQQINLPPTIVPFDALFVKEFGSQQLKIGYVRDMPRALLPEMRWQQLPGGGRVIRMEFTSRDAKGLRIQLAGALNGGAEVRVYDPRGTAVIGPYTSLPGIWEEGEEHSWWTPTIFGESVGLEFYLPAGNAVPSEMPDLKAISYLYGDPSPEAAGIGPGGCLLDVTCFATWANAEARGVGRMDFVEGTSSFLCTGALLNRAPSDLAPIFMTARHCISTQPVANSLNVIWFYQTSVCGGSPPNPNTLPRNTGSRLLKQKHSADWTLLGLYDPARGDFFLGLDASYWGPFSNSTGISHPGGDFKRISFGTRTVDTVCADVGAAFEYWVQSSSGAIRGGSSGSPVFDTNRLVRGTLSCGFFDCPPGHFATYGRLDMAWGNLQYYLLNMASPVFVNWIVAGDPDGEGDSERGTPGNPFKKVYDSTFAVRSGDHIFISAGSYNERFRIWRPMTLHAQAGPVTIGVP